MKIQQGALFNNKQHRKGIWAVEKTMTDFAVTWQCRGHLAQVQSTGILLRNCRCSRKSEVATRLVMSVLLQAHQRRCAVGRRPPSIKRFLVTLCCFQVQWKLTSMRLFRLLGAFPHKACGQQDATKSTELILSLQRLAFLVLKQHQAQSCKRWSPPSNG